MTKKLGDTAMARVLNLAPVLEALPHGFNDGAMPEQGRVGRVKRRSHHILARADNELDAVVMTQVLAERR